MHDTPGTRYRPPARQALARWTRLYVRHRHTTRYRESPNTESICRLGGCVAFRIFYKARSGRSDGVRQRSEEKAKSRVAMDIGTRPHLKRCVLRWGGLQAARGAAMMDVRYRHIKPLPINLHTLDGTSPCFTPASDNTMRRQTLLSVPPSRPARSPEAAFPPPAAARPAQWSC